MVYFIFFKQKYSKIAKNIKFSFCFALKMRKVGQKNVILHSKYKVIKVRSKNL